MAKESHRPSASSESSTRHFHPPPRPRPTPTSRPPMPPQPTLRPTPTPTPTPTSRPPMPPQPTVRPTAAPTSRPPVLPPQPPGGRAAAEARHREEHPGPHPGGGRADRRGVRGTAGEAQGPSYRDPQEVEGILPLSKAKKKPKLKPPMPAIPRPKRVGTKRGKRRPRPLGFDPPRLPGQRRRR